MANNPYVNKVVYGNTTVLDLTNDTVTANDVKSGVTFHDATGASQTGQYSPPTPTSITPDDGTPVQMTTENTYSVSKTGYAIEHSPTSLTPEDSTNPPSIASGTIYKGGGSGYAVATKPSALAPSDSTPAAISNGGMYLASGGGYAIQLYQAKTPDDSDPPLLNADHFYKPTTDGYLYANLQSGGGMHAPGAKDIFYNGTIADGFELSGGTNPICSNSISFELAKYSNNDEANSIHFYCRTRMIGGAYGYYGIRKVSGYFAAGTTFVIRTRCAYRSAAGTYQPTFAAFAYTASNPSSWVNPSSGTLEKTYLVLSLSGKGTKELVFDTFITTVQNTRSIVIGFQSPTSSTGASYMYAGNADLYVDYIGCYGDE